jgi:hypothetical protein
MITARKLIASLVLTLFLFLLAASANADSLVYVVSSGDNGSGIFGTVNLNTGAYQPLGPGEPDGYDGLATGPNGSLVSLTFAGNLDSINPATGVPTRVGPTGMNPCFGSGPTCGPKSVFTLGGSNGKIYATDFANSIFTVNPLTGSAALLAQNSGIPASPFILGSTNPDGTVNVADEAIWQSGGKLYATYDAWVQNFSSGSAGPGCPSSIPFCGSVAIPDELYEIDPTTGLATAIGSVPLGIGAVVDINGTDYAFDDPTQQILTIDPANGSTTVVGNFDFAASGPINGAIATPEPASLLLLGTGLLGLGMILRRKLHLQTAGRAGTP